MKAPGSMHQEFALATVDFLRQTDEFFQNTKLYGPPDFSLPDYDQTVAAHMNESQRTINDCIRQLGGLPLTVTDAESGRSLRCTAEAWQGYDPEEPGNLLWRIKGTSVDEITSLNPSVIDEIRKEFDPSS